MGSPVKNQLITGLSNVRTSPKWSFGGRQGRLSTLNVPGPGSYANTSIDTTSKFSKGARFGFGTSTRGTAYEKPVPGPGSYGHKGITGDEGPAFSCVPRRFKDETQKDMPGPGAHDLPSLVGTGPKYSGTPRRGETTTQTIPGPGAYNQDDQYIMDTTPKWGFGTAKRPGFGKGDTAPGPGAYTMATLTGNGPKYSMQSRRDQKSTEISPGPGANGGQFTQFGY